MKSLLPIVTIFALLGAQGAMACVGCRAPGELVEEQTIQAGIGFSWSILIMLVFVFSILSGFVWYVIRSCKRLEKVHAQNFRK